jgi:hypothetical protein
MGRQIVYRRITGYKAAWWLILKPTTIGDGSINDNAAIDALSSCRLWFIGLNINNGIGDKPDGRTRNGTFSKCAVFNIEFFRFIRADIFLAGCGWTQIHLVRLIFLL